MKTFKSEKKLVLLGKIMFGIQTLILMIAIPVLCYMELSHTVKDQKLSGQKVEIEFVSHSNPSVMVQSD